MDHGTNWTDDETGDAHDKHNLLREIMHLAQDLEIADSMLERFEEQFTEAESEALEDLADHALKRLDVATAKLLGVRVCNGCGEPVDGECWSMAYGQAGEVLLLCPRCMSGPEGGSSNAEEEGYVFL